MIASAAAGGKPAPAPAAAGTPAAAPTPASQAGADVGKLQADLTAAKAELAAANQRFIVLQGKYDREVPQLHREKKTLETRVAELDGLLKRKIDAGEITSLTAAERDLLGENTVKATAKIAGEVAAAAVDAKVQPLNEELARQQEARLQEYFATLDAGMPDWETQNKDPLFIAWLNEIDPKSQRLRKDLLVRADAALSGSGALEIFRAYREKREIGAPKVETLAGRESPGGGGGGDAGGVDVTQAKVWTPSAVKQFYREKREGKYNANPDEARKIEQDIFVAQRTPGRYRPD